MEDTNLFDILIRSKKLFFYLFVIVKNLENFQLIFI